MMLTSSLNRTQRLKNPIKLITGLNNLNCLNVTQKVQAGAISEVGYMDVAANLDILYEIWNLVDVSICVSSINIYNLIQCIKSNVDYVEIGNYDIFYHKGIFLTSSEILDMTKQLLDYKSQTKVCVTVPHYLSFLEQKQLILDLSILGADLIQTEGLSTKLYSSISLIDMLCQASASLSATYIFQNNCNVPVVSSSGFNALSSAVAMIYGAEYVGLGSYLGCNLNTYDYILQIASCTDTILCNTTAQIDGSSFSFNYHLCMSSHLI